MRPSWRSTTSTSATPTPSSSITRCRQRCAAAPSFTLGDLNFAADGAPGTFTTGLGSPSSGRRGATEAKRWARVLGPFTEVMQPAPTRVAYAMAADGEVTVSQSIIGRVGVGLPPSASVSLSARASVPPPTKALRIGDGDQISDHLPLTVRWAARRRLPPHVRPIPLWVARLPCFAALARGKIRRIPHSDLDPRDAHRQALRTAAAQTRECIRLSPASPTSRLHCALQAARARHLRGPRSRDLLRNNRRRHHRRQFAAARNNPRHLTNGRPRRAGPRSPCKGTGAQALGAPQAQAMVGGRPPRHQRRRTTRQCRQGRHLDASSAPHRHCAPRRSLADTVRCVTDPPCARRGAPAGEPLLGTSNGPASAAAALPTRAVSAKAASRAAPAPAGDPSSAATTAPSSAGTSDPEWAGVAA